MGLYPDTACRIDGVLHCPARPNRSLEDPKQVDPASAEIVRKCGEYSVGLFVHEAALRDIARDKDGARRRISISKFDKFQQLKGPNPSPTRLGIRRLTYPNARLAENA